MSTKSVGYNFKYFFLFLQQVTIMLENVPKLKQQICLNTK